MITYTGQYTVEIDMAGKYRVRATCSDRILLFKFQSEPSAGDVQILVDRELNRLNAELEAMVPATKTVYTKLAIRRAMREMGIEEQLDALLDTSPMFRSDWTDATEIDLEDPVLVQALETASIDIEAIKEKLQ